MILSVILVGVVLPYSFGINFENENILQSLSKEIEQLKTANKAEIDELKHQINELQEHNIGLEVRVKELYHEKEKLNQVGDERIDDGVTDDNSRNKLTQMTSSFGIQSSLGTIGILTRQLPADGRVAFTAGLSAGVPNLGPHQTVIFDNAVTNIGNGYHPNSGIFIAPVKGAYVFNLKMKVPPRHKLHLQLVVGGKAVFDLGVEIPSSTDYESANELFIVEVNQGTDVFVRADGTGGLLYGYMRSLFSGFLLFETE